MRVNRKFFISVNKAVIARNNKLGTSEPPIAVRTSRSGKAVYVHKVSIIGDVTFQYDHKNPLPCGAKVWAEVHGRVLL